MIKEVKGRHRSMMDALVLEGKTQREVALEFDITESRLSIIRKSPLWKIEERELRESHRCSQRGRIEALVPRALDALEDALDSGDVKCQIAAAKELLSRGGVAASVNLTEGDDLTPKAMQESYAELQEAKQEILREMGITEEEFIENSEILLNDEG